MTLGLSAARRTVTDTKIDTDEELLKQAFNTAESGVDYYLATGTTKFETVDQKSNADIRVNQVGLENSLVSEGTVIENKPYLFWLAAHKNDGTIDLTSHYSGNSVEIKVDGFNKNLKVDYFYQSGGDYAVSRYLMDFSGVGDTDINTNVGTPVLLAITPIGASAQSISVVGGVGLTFPVQGEEITSVGHAGAVSSDSQMNQVNSQVKVFNQYRVPAFMLDAITSSGSVLSN